MSGVTVVFDLDGTLVDTAPDLVDTLNAVIAREGFSPVPFDTGRRMVGGGARRMIELAITRAGRTLDSETMDRMFSDFITHYAAHIADCSRPFPGLTHALDRLVADGCLLAVCTNKLEHLSRLLLDKLGLSTRFVTICGQDTFGVQKPDPEILRRTIERARGRLDRAVLVGDSANDVEAARAASVPVIAVDFGYSDVPVAHLAPNRVIGHFDALPKAVFDLWPDRG
jgi:phosphoglycolate phosphatase